MNKDLVVKLAAAAVIAGIIGFYGGRYYERESFRKNFINNMGDRMYPRDGAGVRRLPGTGTGDRFYESHTPMMQ